MSVKSKGLTVPDKSAADGANRGIRKYIRHNWQLWIMLFPAMLYILIFCYVPMYGIQLAFREYSFTAGITGGKFVGMKYFRQYFEILYQKCLTLELHFRWFLKPFRQFFQRHLDT